MQFTPPPGVSPMDFYRHAGKTNEEIEKLFVQIPRGFRSDEMLSVQHRFTYLHVNLYYATNVRSQQYWK